jgi:hypothetical protein
MKNFLKYLAILFVTCSFTLTNNEIDDLGAENKTIVNATASFSKDEVYFKLELLGESDEVYFALKRQYPDGRFETVKYVRSKAIQPVAVGMSSFQLLEDTHVPNEDFTYVLMSIDPAKRTFSVIQKWKYCSDTRELCSEELYASN